MNHTIDKSMLIKCLNNENAMKLVYKVLFYNFKDEFKTNTLISLIKTFVLHNEISLKNVHDYIAKNNLFITDDNEKERVNRKVIDIKNIMNKESITEINSILDIGVGNGGILTQLGNEIGLVKEQLNGVDTVDYTTSKGFNHLTYVDNKIPLKEGTIDLIMIMMVLHHTDNPIETLKEAYRVLNENGSVIIRETNAYNNDILEFNIIMEYIFYTILFDIPVSITDNYLSSKSWESLFIEVGFNFKKISENDIEKDPFTSVYYVLTK